MYQNIGIKVSAESRSLKEFKIDIGEYKKLLNESKESERLEREFSSVISEDSMKNNDEIINMIVKNLLELVLTQQMKYLLDHCTLVADSEIFFNKSQAMVHEFGDKFSSMHREKLKGLHNDIKILEKETMALINDPKMVEFSKLVENLGKLGSMTHLNRVFDGVDVPQMETIENGLNKCLNQRFKLDVDLICNTFSFEDGITLLQVIPKESLDKCSQRLKDLEKWT